MSVTEKELNNTLQLLQESCGEAVEEAGLYEAVSVLVSQRDNARHESNEQQRLLNKQIGINLRRVGQLEVVLRNVLPGVEAYARSIQDAEYRSMWENVIERANKELT